jgi:hypothetical protein
MVLRIWRDHPGLDQRFTATLEADAFEGQWQLARRPDRWQDDLKVIYRRRDQIIDRKFGLVNGRMRSRNA